MTDKTMPCQSPDCDRPAEAAVKIEVPGQFFVNYCREHYDAMVELLIVTRLDHSITAVVE